MKWRRPSNRGGLLGEDAQAGSGHDGDAGRRVGPALGQRPEDVVAAAEEGEVVGHQPLDERVRLRPLVGGQALAFARQRLARRHHPLAHGRPVGDRAANVAQHLQQAESDALPGLGVGQGGDLDMHHRLAGLARADRNQPVAVTLHGSDRVDDQIHRQFLALELGCDRVDQERHVVVDDLHHRMAAGPALGVGARAGHADLGHARHALPGEGEEAEGGAVEILGREGGDVLGRDVLGEQAHEPGGGLGLRPGRAAARQGGGLFDPFVLQTFRLLRHGRSPVPVSCLVAPAYGKIASGWRQLRVTGV